MHKSKHYQNLGKVVDKIHRYLESIEKEAMKVHAISCRLYEEDSQKPAKNKVKKSKKRLKKSK
jgi:hypothetical protein